METLLEAANTLLTCHPEEPPRPDFLLPTDYDPHHTHELMECREESKSGRGWFARQDISAGTVLLVAKPVAMVMNWQCATDEEPNNFQQENDSGEIIEDQEEMEVEDEDEMHEPHEDEEEEQDSKPNELLLLQLLSDIRKEPSLWTDKLADLYPRDHETASRLPKWVCQDDAVFIEVEKSLAELREIPELKDDIKDIVERLHLVIRYNVLSVETCPELLVHPGPGGHAALDGSALYHLPSFFNHDSHPNTSRYAVGDVMWFVANQDIGAGDEICISYLEHDVLCESPTRRTAMLQMDFQEPGTIHKNPNDEHDGESDDDGPDFPVVDDEVQNELMGMEPMERLDAIGQLFEQAAGSSSAEYTQNFNDAQEEMTDDEDDRQQRAQWFQCDLQNLRILRAITLDGLGKADEALVQWEECVKFAETHLPPLDESAIVMRVQAALCARVAGNLVVAKQHAAVALQTHCILFGGGVTRFRSRFAREVQLSLRPDREGMEAGGFEALDDLWPSEL